VHARVMVLAVIHLTDVSCSKVGVLQSEEVEVVSFVGES
jgi:hypothetical protein